MSYGYKIEQSQVFPANACKLQKYIKSCSWLVSISYPVFLPNRMNPFSKVEIIWNKKMWNFRKCPHLEKTSSHDRQTQRERMTERHPRTHRNTHTHQRERQTDRHNGWGGHTHTQQIT